MPNTPNNISLLDMMTSAPLLLRQSVGQGTGKAKGFGVPPAASKWPAALELEAAL